MPIGLDEMAIRTFILQVLSLSTHVTALTLNKVVKNKTCSTQLVTVTLMSQLLWLTRDQSLNPQPCRYQALLLAASVSKCNKHYIQLEDLFVKEKTLKKLAHLADH